MHTLTLHDRYVERRNPALGKQYHQTCTCGWQGPWEDHEEAVNQQCPHSPAKSMTTN